MRFRLRSDYKYVHAMNEMSDVHGDVRACDVSCVCRAAAAGSVRRTTTSSRSPLFPSSAPTQSSGEGWDETKCAMRPTRRGARALTL